MPNYEVTVTGFTERFNGQGHPDSTKGGIVIKPPIKVGQGFNDVVLGEQRYGVDLIHSASTAETTVFIAESSRGDLPTRQQDIRTIADRIGTFANNPHAVLDLMNEIPFTIPTSRRARFGPDPI